MPLKEGQHLGVFAHHIPYPEIMAANVLSLGHQWALQKTWRFTPEIDLETYISIQLDYFHTQLLSETAHKELSLSRRVTRQKQPYPITFQACDDSPRLQMLYFREDTDPKGKTLFAFPRTRW